jgi:hypothetical protein
MIIFAIGCCTIASAEGAMPIGGMVSSDQRFTIKSADEPQAGELLYSDDFSDPGSGWKRSSTSESAYAYLDGRYYITASKPGTNFYSVIPTNQIFKDFIVEVEVKAEDVPKNGGYGLALRRDSDSLEDYLFELSKDGQFQFSLWKNAKWITLVGWTNSSAIETGKGSNNIKIIAQGDTFTFYVNGVKLGECTDRSLSSGEIGLVAGARDDGEVHVSFDNLKVWAIPSEEKEVETTREDGGQKLLYSDDFSDVNSGWATKSSTPETVSTGYEDGKYQITVFPKETVSKSWLTRTFSNFVMEVEATYEAGPDNNSYGVILRLSDNEYYEFKISGTGYYGFDKLQDGQWTYLIPWTQSTAINTGKATNLIKVACEGDKFTFYVNDIKLGDCNDNSFSSGYIGLAAETLEAGGAKVSFDNLKVWGVGAAAVSEIPPVTVTPTPSRPVAEGERVSGSSTISSLESGSASTSEGARIDVPAGAVPPNEDGSPGTMVFSIEKDTSRTPSLQGDLTNFGSVYQLGPEGFIFNQPVEITLPIPEGVDPNRVMGITTFNDSSNQWEQIPGTVDPQSRTVTIKTDHFSAYGIFGLSDSFGPDTWRNNNGGWITIMDSHRRGSGTYVGCDPVDTDRHCRSLPTAISHGICILALALNDPSLGYCIPQRLPWPIIASDWNPLRADIIKVWVPAGTYTIQEELGVSEEGNIDPNYLPCCHVKVNPPKAVRITPGSTVDFGDISDFNESQATVCDYCGMCSGLSSRARGAAIHETSVCTGDVQVTLTWHAEADIDLYVEDPNGDAVSYNNPSVSSGGQLDRDNKCGDFVMGRPENICWPKDGTPEGTYKVSVNYYADCADAGPVSWTVRTVVRGQAKTYRGTLNEVKETQEVTTFEVG